MWAKSRTKLSNVHHGGPTHSVIDCRCPFETGEPAGSEAVLGKELREGNCGEQYDEGPEEMARGPAGLSPILKLPHPTNKWQAQQPGESNRKKPIPDPPGVRLHFRQSHQGR
jgi:hypothetical protein